MHSPRSQKWLRTLITIVFLFTFLPAQPGLAANPSNAPLPPDDQPLRTSYDSDGSLTFVGVDPGESLLPGQIGAAASVSSEARGQQVIAQYADEFGLSDPGKELRLDRVDRSESGDTVRYRQQYQGVPVMGGELLVNTDADGSVLSLNGEVSPQLSLPSVQPKVSSEQAKQAAVAGMQSWYSLDASQVAASEPELWIYDPHLLDSEEAHAARLVWRLEVQPVELQPVDELVLVDAQTGTVALHFNQVGALAASNAAPLPPLPPEPSLDPAQEPAPEATLEDAPEPTGQPDDGDALEAAAGRIWYVSALAGEGGDCATPATACASVGAAAEYASDGDSIRIASGRYISYPAVKFTKSLSVSGGWNEDFSGLAGQTIIDGDHFYAGWTVESEATFKIERIRFTNEGGWGVRANKSDVTIRDCSIDHVEGDGVWGAHPQQLKIINTTIAANTGNGIYLRSPIGALVQNTSVVGNGSWGLYVEQDYGATEGRSVVQNSLLADNNGGGGASDCGSYGITIQSNGHNFIKTGQSCTLTSNATDIFDQDPLLRPLTLEGYIPLQLGSPAIDHGSPKTPGSGGAACEARDQLGTRRPIDGDKDGRAKCDIGAYEARKPGVPYPATVQITGGSPEMAGAGQQFPPLSTRVSDQFGAPFPGATVTFSAPESGASGVFAATSGNHRHAVTGLDGVAVASDFSANDQAGKFQVTATVAGVNEPAVFELENYLQTPASIQITAGDLQAAGLGKPFAHAMQVRVFDQRKRPLPGTEVTFTATDAGPGGAFAGGSLTAAALADQDGYATAPAFTAGQDQGSYTVMASVAGTSLQASFTLTNMTIYVSPGGLASNSCLSPGESCSLDIAMYRVQAGSAVYLQSGVYYSGDSSVLIDIDKDDLDLSGGWNADFSAQTEQTILDGQGGDLDGILVRTEVATLSHLIIRGFNTGIRDQGALTAREISVVRCTRGIIVDAHRSLALLNSVISSNSVYGILTSGQVSIQNSTIAGHTDPNGGALFSYSSSYDDPASIHIQSSIFSDNRKLFQGNLNSFVSGGYNLFDQNSCYSNGADDEDVCSILKSTDLVVAEPGLGPLVADYHPLLSGSPAVDVLDGSSPGQTCPPTDLRGVARPQGAGCDIGSFEYAEPGPAAALMALSEPLQSAPSGQFFPFPFRVVVLDALGSLVPGVEVTFNGPSEGAGLVFGNGAGSITITTGADGVASSGPVRANQIEGSYTVSATAAGLSGLSFQLSNGGPIRYIDGANGSDTLPGGAPNPCGDPAAPCRTLTVLYNQAQPWDFIRVTGGDYPEGLQIDDPLYVSGGWDASFSAQTGYSSANVVTNAGIFGQVDHFNAGGDWFGILNYGMLDFTNGSVRHVETGFRNNGDLRLENVTINAASYTADFQGGSVLMDHVTAAGNAYFVRSWLPGAALTLANSILVTTPTPLVLNSCAGTVTSLGHNLITSGLDCSFPLAVGDLVGTRDEPLAAWLAAAQADSAGGMVYPLMPGSPAVDAAGEEFCPPTDQVGHARPNGAGCDIGAYEGVVDGLPPAFSTGVEFFQLQSTILECATPDESCTGGQDADADSAYHYTLEFARMLWDLHQRDLTNGTGLFIRSVVHDTYDPLPLSYTTRILYPDGWPQADDVVGHELAHYHIRLSSRLLEYGQSGAIAESLSDLWGEYFDQSNGEGNDTLDALWRIGEDIPSGAVRSMSVPTLFHQPDRMTSPYFDKSARDSSGVHTNGGVNNKAVFLMVDGGSFNGMNVSAIGWEKTLAMYEYAQTRLLTSGSEYADLYTDLQQACQALTGGGEGITPTDCEQVRLALVAVEMGRKPGGNKYQPEANECPAGMTRVPGDLFSDDFEQGADQWAFGALSGATRWYLAPDGPSYLTYATSGTHSLYGSTSQGLPYNPEGIYPAIDTYAAFAQGVSIPTTGAPMLRFQHALWMSPYEGLRRYRAVEGGLLEYSLDGGATWLDARPLFGAGQNYNGRLLNHAGWFTFPTGLNMRSAFIGDSRGYISSRYNLSKLKGQTVQFRWRLAVGMPVSNPGWFIDDVEIYTCVGKPALPSLRLPRQGSLIASGWPLLDWMDTHDADHYQVHLAADANFETLVQEKSDILDSSWTSDAPPPPANSRYYWRVRGINAAGQAGPWSAVRYFRVRIDPPALSTPTGGAVLTTRRPTFTWQVVDGATSYTLIVSTHTDLSSPLVRVTLRRDYFTSTKNLPAGKTLYWSVLANGPNGPSDWAETRSFTIQN